MSTDRHQPDLTRRRFLISSTAATLGLGLGGRAWAVPATPGIRRYRRLGRTGLEISDISFGSSRTSDPALVRYALERGVNYFDTAEGYKDGRSEAAIGEALQGERERVILASKVKAGRDTPRAEIMKRLEESLRRLRTDRLDLFQIHLIRSLDDVDAICAENGVLKALQKAKDTAASPIISRLAVLFTPNCLLEIG